MRGSTISFPKTSIVPNWRFASAKGIRSDNKPMKLTSPGTALVEAGMSLMDVQDAMGHTTASTAARYIVDQKMRRERVLPELEETLGDKRDTGRRGVWWR